jgi:hypothetical protein
MATIRGGDRSAKVLKALAAKLKGKRSLRAGFLEGAKYPNGTPVALVAAVQNFGAPSRGIPARPFFSNMVAAKKASWPDALAKLVTEHGYDAETALELMGEGIEGQLKEAIVQTNDPPLAPATIERKGFAKPLVDTSHMLHSTGHDVQDDAE